MGTWGTGAFDSDDALDLIGDLTELDPGQRCEALGRIFRRVREHPDDINWTYGPGQVVAAAAVVAAGLPGGETVLGEITRYGHDAGAILLLALDPELSDAAFHALQAAAGGDGAWHDGWVTPEKAAEAKRTTDQLASVFYRYQHRNDQELPFEP